MKSLKSSVPNILVYGTTSVITLRTFMLAAFVSRELLLRSIQRPTRNCKFSDC